MRIASVRFVLPLLFACARPIASSAVVSSSVRSLSTAAAAPSSVQIASVTTSTSTSTALATPTEAPLAWGTRPPIKSDFYPIADGMCIHARVSPLNNAVALLYGQSEGLWTRGGETTAVLLNDDGVPRIKDRGFGKGLDVVAKLGGRVPDKLWAVVSLGGRMNTHDELFVGNTQTGFNPSRTAKEQLDSQLNRFFVGQDADGTFLFSESSSEDNKKNLSFMRLDGEGKPVLGRKSPGADMIGYGALGPGSVFAARKDGELFRTAEDKIIRWSPTKSVNDISLKNLVAPTPESRDSLASIMGEDTFFVAKGTALIRVGTDKASASKLTLSREGRMKSLDFELPQFNKGLLWAVGPKDSLIVVNDATMKTETADGTVTERPVPPGVRAIGMQNGILWLIVGRTKTERDDAFYIDRNGEWQKQSIPEPPFASSTRGGLAIELVTVLAPDDIFLNVRHLEKGLGWQTTEPYRTIYRSKRPREVLRCGDVRGQRTGVGFWPSPPTATADCTKPTLLITQQAMPLPRAYPELANQLRGNKDLGADASFMNLDWQGSPFLAMAVPNVAVGEAVGAKLSKALDIRTRLLCGTPETTRTFKMDVATGKFTF
jgi:hypothetical protein